MTILILEEPFVRIPKLMQEVRDGIILIAAREVLSALSKSTRRGKNALGTGEIVGERSSGEIGSHFRIDLDGGTNCGDEGARRGETNREVNLSIGSCTVTATNARVSTCEEKAAATST